MIEHHLRVQRTARYYTLGEFTHRTKNIWFCLHGFGQLAQYFGRKFTALVDDETLIIVPEGLSRLYLNGDYQRVGASWLTREDKEHEIEDFLAYLNSLYDLILNGHDVRDYHITLLGFSQGAATACRWLNNRNAGPRDARPNYIHVDRLLLWAGFFPNGPTDLIDSAKLASVETHYVYGKQDDYFRHIPNVDAYLRRMQTEVPALTITAFDGGHRIEPAVLHQLVTGPGQIVPGNQSHASIGAPLGSSRL